MPEINTSHIIAFSAGVGFLGLLFAILNRFVDTRAKIAVEHGYSHQLISEGNRFLPETTPFIYKKLKIKVSFIGLLKNRL